ESLRASLPPEVTRQWHERLVRALEPLPGASPEMLSVHLAGAGETRRAAEYAVRAAHEAADALAFERSVRLFRRALELHAASGDGADSAPMYRLEIALAEALVNAGRSCEAAEVFARAAAHAPAAEALDLRRRAGEAFLVGGEVDRGVDVISA